jgi:hypothetical protein
MEKPYYKVPLLGKGKMNNNRKDKKGTGNNKRESREGDKDKKWKTERKNSVRKVF